MKNCKICNCQIDNKKSRKYCDKCSKMVRKEKQRQYAKKFKTNNKDKIREYYRRPEVRKRIKEKFGEYNRNYGKRTEVLEYKRLYMRNLRKTKEYKKQKNKKDKIKTQTDSNYRMRKLLRGRISKAIHEQSGEKAFKSIELLGDSIKNVMNYLQITAINNGYKDFDINNFDSKMYHIDHIKPCSLFDLTKPEEQKKCFNWSNMQILTSYENIIKRDKILC